MSDSEASHADPVPTMTKAISWRKKLLFSVLTTVGFFLLLEVALTFLGVRPETETSDPFVGFDKQIPLFVVSAGKGGQEVVSTAENKLVWFNAQSFPLDKKPGTKRVFCLGGSTTFGRPYNDLTSFAGWLREFLPAAAPEQQWEVINAGGISYASYRVAAVMEELTQYDPDLFLVYTGQNEFLERRTYEGMFEQSGWSLRTKSALRRSRTWAALRSLAGKSDAPQAESSRETISGEVDEMLNHTVGPAQYHRDPTWRRKVVHHFETNLSRMVTLARSAGAELVFITPASNEKDNSPFKSELRDDLDAKSRARFQELLTLADQESEAGNWESAFGHLREAAKIDQQYADLHFRMGRVLLRLNRAGDAKSALLRAVDEDICPLRAVSEISSAIRRVSAQHDVPLLDFEARLRSQCRQQWQHECLGGEYFLDHVHPTIEVHQQLALWILESLAADGFVEVRRLSKQKIEQVDHRVRNRIDRRAQGVALRNLAKVLHWSGKFQEARPRAVDALTMIPDDPESRYVLADCLIQLGQREEGFQEYDRLFREGDFPPGYLPYGELLAEREDFEAARNFLTLAVVAANTDQRLARAQYALGSAYLQLKEFPLAEESLQAVNELYPGDAKTLSLLAEAKAGLGKSDEAIELFRQILVIEPNRPDLHNRVGLLFLKAKQVNEAIRAFESALKVNPDDPDARRNLTIAMALKKNQSADE